MVSLRQRPTPEEWQIVAWMVIVPLVVMGVVGLWYASGAGSEKAEIAQQLRTISLACWGLAAGVWAMKRGLEWFVA